ncbi:MAG: glycerol-3-phosphate cytidylyltransferase [Clostridiales Family XIII bacterium]|jgi:glycerol-3-phosphate cytidylyltransferase|nr:glycerol-3-phosphate cytidylyltransferase [Clostridiales Family XIII bacterium]
MKKVLTYGTYDMLHHGHIRLLKRARELGDFLIVGLSTDEFNAVKGKEAFYDYGTRKEVLEAVKYVDLVIPESSWGQKPEDIREHEVDVVAMGSDWEGSDRFEYLKEYCEVAYLPRTEGISTTQVKDELSAAKAEEKP